MPKVANTKKIKAEKLLRTLEDGPHPMPIRPGENPEQWFRDNCRIWLNSWIIPEVKRLIPELRRPKQS